MIQTPKINLIHGDCMELMWQTPDGYYDLAIVDVNYGIKEDGRNNHTRGKLAKAKDYRDRSRYDNDSPPAEYFSEMFRTSKNQIVWGANHFISKMPYDSPCWICWDKENGTSDFADFELAWTSFKTAARKVRFRWAGMLQGDMKNKQERIHPNEKPIPLYGWLLENYAKPGDRILDTHGGSMSIAIACYDLGFDLDLTELDKDYYDAGVARFERHRAQGQLFHAPATQLPEQQKMF